VKDNSGGTALHWAAGDGHEEVVGVLLDMGADIGVRDGHGETALYWVARNAHDGVVGMLLEKAAEIPGKNLPRTDTKLYEIGEKRVVNTAAVQQLIQKLSVSSYVPPSRVYTHCTKDEVRKTLTLFYQLS
jgi:ankyrin repeat protein